MHKGSLKLVVYRLSNAVCPVEIGFLDAEDMRVNLLHHMNNPAPEEIVSGSGQGVNIFRDDSKVDWIFCWNISPVIVCK